MFISNINFLKLFITIIKNQVVLFKQFPSTYRRFSYLQLSPATTTCDLKTSYDTRRSMKPETLLSRTHSRFSLKLNALTRLISDLQCFMQNI